MKTIIITLVWVLIPSLAIASCPSSFDTSGIILSRTQPAAAILYRKEENEVVVQHKYGEKAGQLVEIARNEYYRGLFPSTRHSKKNTINAIYAKNFPSDFFPLEVGKKWSSSIKYIRDGTQIAKGNTTFTVQGLTQTKIGQCLYKVFKIFEKVELVTGVKRHYSRLYSNDLGVVLETLVLDGNMKPVTRAFYQKIEKANRK